MRAAGSTGTRRTARAPSPTGDLPDELAQAYEVCLEAELAGLDAYGPGVSGRDADAAARDLITAAGFGENFGHGLGHGIGLRCTRAGGRDERLTPTSAENVIHLEPGIYIPAAAASASRTWCSSPTTAASGSPTRTSS